MNGFRYAMTMFTLVLILGRVSPATEQGLWQLVAGAWFIGMIISLVSELITYGKSKKSDEENGDEKGK